MTDWDDCGPREAAVRGAAALLVAVLPAGLYAGGAAWLALLEQAPWEAVVCYDPWTGGAAGDRASAAHVAARLSMAAGAVLFLAGPWLSGMLLLRAGGRRETAHAWSFVLNAAALVAVCLVLRHTAGIERWPLFVAWTAWGGVLAAGAAFYGRPPRELSELWRARRGDLALAVAAAGLGMAVFWGEHFQQCFDGDGVETFELAASLRDHFLPTWQIEITGEFGAVIVNPSFINSYWTLAAQVLLGAGEFATRLPFWVYWVAIVLVCGGMLCGRSGFPAGRGPDDVRLESRTYGDVRLESRTHGGRRVLLLVMGLWAVWYTFSVGYDPYMADVANPGVPDALFTLLFVLSMDCLRKRDFGGWVACTLCASLVLYAGPVLFALTVLAGLVWLPERRDLLRAAAKGTAGLLVIGAFYLVWGWQHGLLEAWWSTLEAEYVREYFAPLPRLVSGALFAGYFVLGCGGLPAWGLVRGWAGSGWERTTAAVTLAYLAIVLGSGVKNLHYLGPLIPLTIVLWARRPAAGRRGSWTDRLAVLTVAAAIVASWPRERPVFTLPQELGADTTFHAASYEEACRLAEWAVIYDLGVVSWEIGPHTWVYYAERTTRPSGERPLLVTPRESAPPGYEFRAQSPFGVWLFVRDRDWLAWASSRQPLLGPDRVAAVFRPIANRPRPRLVYRKAE